MASLDEIVRHLDTELRSAEVPDYDAALNGLQLTNAGASVSRVAAAVDFSLQSVNAAVREGADLLIVHHGMFWRGSHRLVGPAFERIRAALDGGLAIYSSHIPLDLHQTLGNNVLLAKELSLRPDTTFGKYKGVEIGVAGECDLKTQELADRLTAFSKIFRTSAVATTFDPTRRTKRWAMITGAGVSADTLEEARVRGVDTMIVGEGTHHTGVQAMEMGIVVMYGGHYATETLGVRALAEHIAKRFKVTHTFVDVPTGL